MRSSTHLPSLLGSLLFTVGAVFILGLAVLLGVVALSTLFTGQPIELRETILLAVTSFEGILLLAAAFFSFQKYLQKPSAEKESNFSISWWQIAACLLIASAAILIGYQIINKEPVNWLFIPLLTIPAVVLPILVLLGLGVRGISLGPRWRTWNVLGISMTLVPLLIFILEGIVILLIFIFGLIYITTQPHLMAQLERLSNQIYTLEQDPEALIKLITPLLLRPGILAVALIFFGFLVPLIEELFKPLGVWLFGNQISSPSQGFVLGALSGAAYALIETLGVTPQSGDWATLLLTRFGTDVLHVATSAMMGAAIVYAIQERRYLRLLGIYLLCVSLHGLWNSLAIVFTFSSMAGELGKPGFLEGLTTGTTVGLVIFTVALLLTLFLLNRRMRSEQSQPVPEELVP
ncbi:MAG: PrsW family glutamic-type intramembrane protease [Syntrophothermus sp.]